MSMSTAQLESLVLDLAAEKLADRVEARLSPAQLADMERAAIDRRIGRLALEEARVRLCCSSIPELRRICRERGIPILYESRKRQFILLRDIEDADARQAAIPAAPSLTVLAREETAHPPAA